jgi:hypothetical protein
MVNNIENLVSLADRTTEEQRAIAVQGGIASGQARKKKKSLREKAKLLLSLSVQDQEELLKAKKLGLTDEDIDLEMMNIIHMYNIVKKENFNSVGAFNSLKELTDEEQGNGNTQQPILNINIQGNDNLKEAFYEQEEKE